MATPKQKAQFSVHLDPGVMQAVSAFAARGDQSMSLIAAAAIASFLSRDADERKEAAIDKRLEQQDRRLARLERDVEIGVETSALLIRFWLKTTSPLPESVAFAARAQAAACCKLRERRRRISYRHRHLGRRDRHHRLRRHRSERPCRDLDSHRHHRGSNCCIAVEHCDFDGRRLVHVSITAAPPISESKPHNACARCTLRSSQHLS
jgi:predicted transcriptional regulator